MLRFQVRDISELMWTHLYSAAWASGIVWVSGAQSLFTKLSFFGCPAPTSQNPSFEQRGASHHIAQLLSLACEKPALFSPMFYSPAFTFSSVYSLGFCRVPGFAFGRCAGFKPFWPPALVQQAPPAIILAALRRFRGPAVFRGLRPSSRLGAPFWPSGLDRKSVV